MRIQKLLAIGAAAVLSSACFALPAFAHGHGHHRYYVQQTQVNCPAICTIEGCTEVGRHTHDGVDYCGYNHSIGYCDGSCVYGGHHGCYY